MQRATVIPARTVHDRVWTIELERVPAAEVREIGACFEKCHFENIQFEQCKVGSFFLSRTKSASKLWSCMLKETDATKEVFEISRRNWKPNTVRYAPSSESVD